MADKELMYVLVDEMWRQNCTRLRIQMVTPHTPGMPIDRWISLQQQNKATIDRQMEEDNQAIALMTRWTKNMLTTTINASSKNITSPELPYDVVELQHYVHLMEEYERSIRR